MWSLFCLPGRLLTEWDYLYPGRGQLWASSRRRESGCLHVLISTVFWILFGIFVVPVAAGVISAMLGMTPRHAHPVHHDTQASAGPTADVPDPDDVPASTSAASSDQTIQSQSHRDAETRTPKAERSAAAQPSLDESAAIDPLASDAMQAAMRKAADTGDTQRWKDHKLHGYAVPSQPAADGCRMIQVSIDHASTDTAPVKLCPTP